MKLMIRKLIDICDGLSVEDSTLLRGNRVVIPPPLRKSLLTELHEAHPRNISNESPCPKLRLVAGHRQRNRGISLKDARHANIIKNIAPNCPQHIRGKLPNKPWSRLHMDFAGPFFGKKCSSLL